jgi:hypothetical protein
MICYTNCKKLLYLTDEEYHQWIWSNDSLYCKECKNEVK